MWGRLETKTLLLFFAVIVSSSTSTTSGYHHCASPEAELNIRGARNVHLAAVIEDMFVSKYAGVVLASFLLAENECKKGGRRLVCHLRENCLLFILSVGTYCTSGGLWGGKKPAVNANPVVSNTIYPSKEGT